jgi:hypothetical protein
MRPLIALCVLSLLSALTGCTGYRTPTIHLTDVAPIEVTDVATALRFSLDVTNPNDEPVELREVRYSLAVDRGRVFEGRRAVGTMLHGGATTRVELPAVVPDAVAGFEANARPADVEYRLAGELIYVTPGELAEILLDTGVRRPTARFAESGRLSLSR